MNLLFDSSQKRCVVARTLVAVTIHNSMKGVKLMKTSIGTMVLSTLTLLCMVDITVSAQVQWALDTVLSTGAYSSGIAITPDGSKLVVTNNTNPGAVKVISTSNYAIYDINISSIENYPNVVTITPNGSTALVNTLHKTVFIDLSNNSIKGNFAAPCVGTTLYGIAVTPNGNNAIFPDLSSGCTQQGLRSINAPVPSASSSFIQVNTSGVLYGIAITPDSASAIVTTFTRDFPKKVNLSTFGVQNITGFNGSYGVATLHHSSEALIEGDSLKRVSLTTNTATKIISDIYSTALQGIAITADDKYAFVVGSFNKVVVDLASNTVIQTFTAGGTSVATMSDGSRFFVTDSYNGTVRVYKKLNPSGVEDDHNSVPFAIALEQNYPNPFNPSTNISFTLPSKTFVLLKVFNLLGEEVATLVNEELPPGTHLHQWNAGAMPSGVYFYRLQAGSFTETKKLLLLR
jgi:hypothetical protein